jgi:Lysylphosphatidylglycerol synthase TM region
MRAGVRQIAGRVLLALVGLTVIALLVRSAGPQRVAETLWQARWWLPLIVAFEVVQMSSDFLTLRVLLGAGASEVPAVTWLRASALAYAMMIVVPAGRAAGEVARATLLSAHIGAPRAVTASTQLQASSVFAVALVSAVEAAVVAQRHGIRSPLALLLVGNAVMMTAGAAALLAILWNARGSARVQRWLDRIRRRLTPEDKAPAALEAATRRRLPWQGVVFCSLSRTAQAVQYGVILFAVGGAPSVRGAIVAHGIELVGATLGDLLPNKVGVVDGAYRTFAADVGLGAAPARALSIALLARIASLVVTAACLVVLVVSRRAATPVTSPRASLPPSAGKDSSPLPLT